MIKFKNITKEFKEKKALLNVSFNVNEGDIFGFLGPSGSGKTTTINILTGQILQDSGQAFILGKNSTDISSDDLLSIGIMIYTLGLYENMSIYTNFDFFAKLQYIRDSNS